MHDGSPSGVSRTAPPDASVTVRLATDADRDAIYRIRHDVYARELGQHSQNDAGRLSDALDAFNLYYVAESADTPGGRPEIIGFVSLTPPGSPSFSVDKYLPRSDIPFPFDDGLFEGRILTVVERHRRGPAAMMLLHACFEHIRRAGGRAIIIIGRREVARIYEHVGFRRLGRTIRSGAVTYELMGGTLDEIEQASRRDEPFAKRLIEPKPRTNGQASASNLATQTHSMSTAMTMEAPSALAPTGRRNVATGEGRAPRPEPVEAAPLNAPRPGGAKEVQDAHCDHGGAFYRAIGADFSHLERRESAINADVLDAWFPPSPRVIAALSWDLAWTLHTSPPTHAEGLIAAIAAARNLPPDSIAVGAGSSDLIFRALPRWLTRDSRVLILDPMYGEYAHVLERVIGCRVDRFTLSRADNYAVDLPALAASLAGNYDLLILVNPNNPTGRHIPRAALLQFLQRVPARTRVWIDETYTDYAGPDETLEPHAAASSNTVICKSMSKVYALSGVRAAYLVAPPDLAADLRLITPPWPVSLPAQMAAIEALRDPTYYASRHAETHALRADLATNLRALGLNTVEGVINSVLCHLPAGAPDAHDISRVCADQGIFIRDCASISTVFGTRAIRAAVRSAPESTRIVAAIRAALSREPVLTAARAIPGA